MRSAVVRRACFFVVGALLMLLVGHLLDPALLGFAWFLPHSQARPGQVLRRSGPITYV
jgi:hypothetical protein